MADYSKRRLSGIFEWKVNDPLRSIYLRDFRSSGGGIRLGDLDEPYPQATEVSLSGE